MEIKIGDRVMYFGEPGEIEFVADPMTSPAGDWYVEEFGGGVMISEPKYFGSLFLSNPEDDNHLEFVARAGD